MGGNGAIYSVKPVSLMASRKAGEWQEVEATIKGNRISVTLNGVQVHDNVEVNRATSSELIPAWINPVPCSFRDHGAVALRNIASKCWINGPFGTHCRDCYPGQTPQWV